MTHEKMGRHDFRFIIICLLLLIGTVWFSIRNFSRAFPEATIDFRITREQAQQQAFRFLTNVITLPDGYKQVTIFDYDDQTKIFMERTLGLDRANALFDDRVKIWKWRTRWFKPLTKQEFVVELTPRGHLAGFRRIVSEDEPGARLTSEQARPLAEHFLERYAGVALDALDCPQIKRLILKGRIDHTFTWTLKDFSVAGAPYTYQVHLIGRELGGYTEALQVPESWVREYSSLLSLNNTTGTVALLVTVLAFLGLLIYFFIRVMAGDVRWPVALAYGAIAFCLYFINDLNQIPLRLANYVTTESYAGFVFGNLFQGLMMSLTVASIITIIVATAESFYRRDYPDMVSIEALFSLRAMRSKKFFRDVLFGYTLSGLFLACQIVFYLLADRFGAWSPADIPYSNIVNTYVPWIAVLLIGFLPAVSEEFFDRIFLISFLQRLLHSRLGAIFLAAMIWGFGHAAYPNQPFYIRGLEVGLAGIVCGFVLVRFGVLPLLVWHYTIDAFYTAMVFFRSSHLYFIIMALFSVGIMLAPLLLSLFGYIRRGYFESGSSLTNSLVGISRYQNITRPATLPDSAELSYRPLGRTRLMAVTLGLVALCAGLHWFAGHYPKIERPTFQISPSSIQEQADIMLTEQGGVLSHYQSLIYLADNFVVRREESEADREDEARFSKQRDRLGLTYILHQGGTEHYNRLRQIVPERSWTVRYYHPLSKEEWRFSYDISHGQLLHCVHLMPKDQAGSHLNLTKAMARATAFLDTHHISIEDFQLVEQEAKVRANRTDYLFTWEKNERCVGEATERIFIILRGTRIGEYKKYINIPEAWSRQRQQRTLLWYVRLMGQILVMVFLSGIALLLLYGATTQHRMNWKAVLYTAAIPTTVILLNEINHFPLSFASYPTAIHPTTFLVYQLAGSLISLVMYYVMFVFLLALLDARFNLLDRLNEKLNNRRQAIEALWLIFPTGLCLLAYQYIVDLIRVFFPGGSTVPSAQTIIGLDLPFPFLQQCESVLVRGLLILAVLTVAETAYHQFFKHKILVIPALVLLACLTIPLELVSLSEYGVGLVQTTMVLVGVFGLARFLFRGNSMAYLIAVFVLPLLHKASLFLELESSFYATNGIVLIILASWLLFYPIKAIVASESKDQSGV